MPLLYLFIQIERYRPFCRRRYLAFPSNKLTDLGTFQKVWEQTQPYRHCAVVRLKEKIYTKLPGWHTTHPNLSWFERERKCPVCQSPDLYRNGFRYLKSGDKQRVTCRACGHISTPGPLIKHDSYGWWG
jgi:hypothetical protein